MGDGDAGAPEDSRRTRTPPRLALPREGRCLHAQPGTSPSTPVGCHLPLSGWWFHRARRQWWPICARFRASRRLMTHQRRAGSTRVSTQTARSWTWRHTRRGSITLVAAELVAAAPVQRRAASGGRTPAWARRADHPHRESAPAGASPYLSVHPLQPQPRVVLSGDRREYLCQNQRPELNSGVSV